MATTVVKQFVATIASGSTFVWSMTNADPPFNPKLTEKAQPNWLVDWQAIPLVVNINPDDPGVKTAKVGLQISPVIIVQENDTSLTHIVSITCHDAGNPPPGARFVATYVLYAIFIDVP